jgi:LPS O-antigen subunit length determinant protein (WzzB/FepE family)
MKGKDGVETGGRPLRALIHIMLALVGFMMTAVVLLASCMY